MTNEEAIKELDGEYAFNDAIRLAIEVLEKQVPMKQIYADGCECYKCPNCGSQIFKDWDSHIFCPNCGQALKWEE